MLNSHWMTSSSAAKAYYRQTDYYATCPGEWLGKGASMLGLSNPASAEQFDKLADNLHPVTGERLTTYTRDGRRVGMDLTFNATKSVSIARELADLEGDASIEAAHREAVAYTVGKLESDMQARVRSSGQQANRTTGNLVAYRVTHRDTRINADDQRPDMSLHDHVFVLNATYDPVEDKWKAAELGQIKHDLPFYESMYHNRLAANLREQGYGIERRGKSFEIVGISEELREKFSRRSQYINEVADKLGIINPKSKAKLGATTRLGKADELADDLRGYYVSRLTEREKQELFELRGRDSEATTPEQAVRYALSHVFERQSVAEEKQVYETALRYGIGSVSPEQVEAEAKRQGLLVKDGQATTREVLAEERRVIQFARDGKGTCRAMGRGPDATPATFTGRLATSCKGLQFNPTASSSTINRVSASHAAANQPDFATLSPQQQAICHHVWQSHDRVILIRGAAGTGKTHTMKAVASGIDRPLTVLAPSADASRGVLRDEGFEQADTVARFLMDEGMQAQAKDGVIWVDEAGLLGMKQARALFEIAHRVNARVILQGDSKQHGSVPRGALMRVLQDFAGLPVAELTDIRRQAGRYKKAIKLLSEGKSTAGFDALNKLGWVKQADHAKLVDDYMAAKDSGKSVLAIAPTHAEGKELTAEIRSRMQLGEERTFNALTPTHWTEAEKEDLSQLEGDEIFQYHRKSGSFQAGERVAATDFKTGQSLGKPSAYSVYKCEPLSVAVGDTIRITANGKTADGKHRLNNGSQYTVAGFSKQGGIVLDNGWTLASNFGHLTHGYVTTSHASQGKTVQEVFIAMGGESGRAISSEQFYVSASRGRQKASIYTDMQLDDLRQAVVRGDARKSASELIPNEESRKHWWMQRIIRRLRKRMTGDRNAQHERKGYGQLQRTI